MSALGISIPWILNSRGSIISNWCFTVGVRSNYESTNCVELLIYSKYTLLLDNWIQNYFVTSIQLRGVLAVNKYFTKTDKKIEGPQTHCIYVQI